MSWQLQFGVDTHTLSYELTKEQLDYVESVNPGASTDAESAYSSAVSLLDTLTNGNESRHYLLTLSGHRNANHLAAAGLSKDFIQVAVSQQ